MNSSKGVTKYETLSEGTLEWEIQDFGLHFKLCDKCWTATTPCHSCPVFQIVQSPQLQLAADRGKHSKWSFAFTKKRVDSAFILAFKFDGLFASDGSPIDEPCTFRCKVAMESSMEDKVTPMLKFDGGKNRVKKQKDIPCLVKQIEITPEDLKRAVYPNGDLKVTAEVSHLSVSVQNSVSSPFLELLDLKDSLSNCYGNLLNNSELSDFKIICEGSTFHAHKLILSVRSPVFRAMLESGMSESTKNKLEIKDMTIQTLKLMLEYIYKGTVESFPEDLKEKVQLLDCAEKYELDGLKSICMRKLFSNPATEKDVGKLAMTAFTYGANERAVKAIKDFCMTNHVTLMQNPEYKKLFLANPQAFVN